MKEYKQFILLGSILLCAYFGYLLNKQAQETNTPVMEIIEQKKGTILLIIMSILGILWHMNNGEDGGSGLNLFGQDKLCTTEFYDQV